MDDLYRVVILKDDEVAIKLSDESHPVFQAHFPDMPILPAFMSLDIIEKLFNLQIVEVKKAKFLKPILPNETITYVKTENIFKVLRKNEVVVSLNLLCQSVL